MKIKKRISDDPKAIAEIKSNPKARLTADVDAKIHGEFKSVCAINGVKMNEVIEELMRKYLNKQISK